MGSLKGRNEDNIFGLSTQTGENLGRILKSDVDLMG